MSQNPVQFSPAEWAALREKYSELKHTVNNALAVFMAHAELAKRNPENFEKLAAGVGSRTPEIVARFTEFTQLLDDKARE